MPTITVTCPCGKPFTTTEANQRRGWGRFCSRACAANDKCGKSHDAVTDEYWEKLVARYAAGESLRNIVASSSHSRSQIQKRIIAAGVKLRDRAAGVAQRRLNHYRMPADELEQKIEAVMRAYQAGEPSEVIADRHGISRREIDVFRQYKGIKARTER